MSRAVVLVFEVISPYVPLEITGYVDGRSFYYRARHERWAIWPDLLSYGTHPSGPLAGGHIESDENETSLTGALTRIVDTFSDAIHDHPLFSS